MICPPLDLSLFFFLMIRRPPRSTLDRSSAASDVYKRQLVKNSKFTSIYLEEFTCVVRDTKLGPEITTRDIPNVGELKLKDLDEDGIVLSLIHISEPTRPY